jgi:hypothetical protein
LKAYIAAWGQLLNSSITFRTKLDAESDKGLPSPRNRIVNALYMRAVKATDHVRVAVQGTFKDPFGDG